MAHWMRLVISTALIGTVLAVIMVVIAYRLGYNIDPVVLGWVFGVLAMGMVDIYDNYSSHHTTTGGK